MNQRGLSADAVEKLRSTLVLCRCSSNTTDGQRAYYSAISALDDALAAQDAPEPDLKGRVFDRAVDWYNDEPNPSRAILTGGDERDGHNLEIPIVHNR